MAAPPLVSPAALSSHRRTPGKMLRTAGYYLLVILVCAVTFFPIYWMIITTIRPTKFNLHYPPKVWPTHVNLTVFRDLFAHESIGRWIVNSTLIALMVTAICVFLAVLGAYVISAMRWRGRSAFAIFLLMTQMLPEALILVPIFEIYQRFPILHISLRESLPGVSLIDAAFILPIGVWILKNMFDTIPREVREAAVVDGAGPFRVLFQIVLPLSLPGLVAVGVVAFFYAWNEFLFAQTMITDKANKPASVGLASMITMLDTPIERLLAAGLVFAIPPVIFYIIMQRYIVSGITAGAVKG
ncbi:MAG TPA: carbohydrate ABC transporter permease [Thermomicrobiales bacterium]|nr:carbohydrate ABC transporter permease [Thermomicrobiales bacterium]